MFMLQAISEKADLIVLDDPITSFDKDKKFAIIRRLFDNKKDIVNEVTKEKLMLLIDGDDTYSKIIAIRLLFERYDGLLIKL